MPGHNGGFNPFRDANGEFCEPGQAGKPGRSRAGSGGASRARSARPALTGQLAGKFGNSPASRSNRVRSPVGSYGDDVGYRGKPGRGRPGAGPAGPMPSPRNFGRNPITPREQADAARTQQTLNKYAATWIKKVYGK